MHGLWQGLLLLLLLVVVVVVVVVVRLGPRRRWSAASLDWQT
jgi:hypothetical protein